MDDRLPKIQLNNPIPLHFYSPEERIPEENVLKLLIYRSDDSDKDYGFGVYAKGRWYTLLGIIDNGNIIAWASFSPEWVLGVDL